MVLFETQCITEIVNKLAIKIYIYTGNCLVYGNMLQSLRKVPPATLVTTDLFR